MTSGRLDQLLADFEQVLAGILRARNDAVHLYHLALADALRARLPGFAQEFRRLFEAIRQRGK